MPLNSAAEPAAATPAETYNNSMTAEDEEVDEEEKVEKAEDVHAVEATGGKMKK